MAGGSKLAKAWPFTPKEVGLNQDTNLLKLVAVITMLIDHTGKMFFSHYHIMRIIGRMAFPIYAYCIAAGCVYSRDKFRYFKRIVILGLISQPFYAVALGHTIPRMYEIPFASNPVASVVNFYIYSWNHPSIMLTLALGLLMCWAIRERQISCALALALLVWRIQGSVDYGWRGVALIVLFYLFISRWWLSLPVMLAYMLWWGVGSGSYQLFGIHFSVQAFMVLALPLVYIPTYSKLKINKWVYYLFYPAHLIGMMLIEFAMKLS